MKLPDTRARADAPALVIAFSATALQAALLMVGVGAGFEVVFAAACAASVLCTGWLGGVDGRFELRQPWCVLLIFHVPFWVVGTFKVVVDPGQQAMWIPGASSRLPAALFAVSLGFLAISLGYRLGVQVRIRLPAALRHSGQWRAPRLIAAAWLIYAAVWLVRWGWYWETLDRPFLDVVGGDAASTTERMFGSTIPAALIVAAWAAQYRFPSPRLSQLAWTLTAGELLWGLAYGVMKSLLFLPLFLPVLPHMVIRGRVPWRRIGLAAGLLLVLIYPFVDAVRDIYFQPGGPRRTQAIAAVLSQEGSVRAGRGSVSYFADRALNRVSGIGSVAQILQLDAEGALDLNGAFYWRALVGLVPRPIWPGKPIIHEGSYLTAYLEGQRGLESVDLSRVYGSTAPTLFGSFLWNLGWPGLVASALALGVFSGLAYRAFLDAGLAEPSTFLYYGALLGVLETTETEVAKFPATLVWSMGLAWLANSALTPRVSRAGKTGWAQRTDPKVGP